MHIYLSLQQRRIPKKSYLKLKVAKIKIIISNSADSLFGTLTPKKVKHYNIIYFVKPTNTYKCKF